MNYYNNKVIKAAKELLKTYGYFVDKLWHVNDVHFICEQNNLPKLSDAEAMEVFAIACDNFDGETGLSWPELEKAVRSYLKRESIIHRETEETN